MSLSLFRLLDVKLQLHALNDHYEMIQSQLNNLIEKENKTTPEHPYDEDSCIAHAEEKYHRCEVLFPRVFYGSYVITLHSVLESSLIEICNTLQNEAGLSLKVIDINGSILIKAKKYFESVLHLDFITDNKINETLKHLVVLRNAFAHSNGQISMLKEGAKKQIEQFETMNIGIKTHMGLIIIEEKFALSSLRAVEFLVQELSNRRVQNG